MSPRDKQTKKGTNNLEKKIIKYQANKQNEGQVHLIGNPRSVNFNKTV